jgi:hypothetical protein
VQGTKGPLLSPHVRVADFKSFLKGPLLSHRVRVVENFNFLSFGNDVPYCVRVPVVAYLKISYDLNVVQGTFGPLPYYYLYHLLHLSYISFIISNLWLVFAFMCSLSQFY